MGIVFPNTKEYGSSNGEGKSQQNERPKLIETNLKQSVILSNSQAIRNQKVTNISKGCSVVEEEGRKVAHLSFSLLLHSYGQMLFTLFNLMYVNSSANALPREVSCIIIN